MKRLVKRIVIFYKKSTIYVAFTFYLVMMGYLLLYKETQKLSNELLQSTQDSQVYKDPAILRTLRTQFLQPPSTNTYNLMEHKTDAEAQVYNQFRTRFESFARSDEILKKIFGNSANGFFVEAGALDGEFISNTLYLEEYLGWTGLLIEPDIVNYRRLLEKNRKCWSSNTCISPSNQPTTVEFKSYNVPNATLVPNLLARSTSNIHGYKGIYPPAQEKMGIAETLINIMCFPLSSYLAALNRTYIDYISLDVEGSESSILLSFPWNDFTVRVWSIEHQKVGHHFLAYDNTLHGASERDNGFINFMALKNYKLLDYHEGDYIFVHNSSGINYVIE